MATESLAERVYRLVNTPGGQPMHDNELRRHLQETADELERCWISLGQVKPNRHVTAARALLQAKPSEVPTAAEVVDALAAKFRAVGFQIDNCQDLLDVLNGVEEFTYKIPAVPVSAAAGSTT